MASSGDKKITSGATIPATVPPYSPRPQDENTDKEISHGCIMCDKKASLRCPTCGTWYCGPECYRQDWPLHKTLCRTLEGILYSDSKRPPHHVRGILFPADCPFPTFVWLDKRAIVRHVDDVLGARGDVKISPDSVDGVHRKNRRHQDNTSIVAFFGADEQINQSILALSKPGHTMPAEGPICFCCYKRAKEQPESRNLDDHDWVDATPGTFRDIVDFHMHLDRNPCIVDPVRFPLAEYSGPNCEAKIWPAVKLNCEGDIKRFSRFCYGEESRLPLAEEVSVLSICQHGRRSACHLPQLAGLPWVMQSCTTTNLALTLEQRHNYGGRVFAPEDKLSSPETVLDGVLPATHCGTIMVLHKEGAPIYVSHVLCFFDFIEVQLRQATMQAQRVLEPGTHRILLTREQLESRVTKERFLEYWTHWIEDKFRDAEHKIRYTDLRSPYDFKEMEEDQKLLAHVTELGDTRRDLGMH
ncbi:hypothetical protein F5X96DRAFT_692565 [Biscogniauxia mediterranea]|nr:hypothetical protein F5X96DRAFT_692565 [Biscogniauxia mediterranea]